MYQLSYFVRIDLDKIKHLIKSFLLSVIERPLSKLKILKGKKLETLDHFWNVQKRCFWALSGHRNSATMCGIKMALFVLWNVKIMNKGNRNSRFLEFRFIYVCCEGFKRVRLLKVNKSESLQNMQHFPPKPTQEKWGQILKRIVIPMYRSTEYGNRRLLFLLKFTSKLNGILKSHF